MFLQLLAEKRMLKNTAAYQLVELPGKKILARRLESRLREVSAQEALDHADEILVLEEMGDAMRDCLGNRSFLTLTQYAQGQKESWLQEHYASRTIPVRFSWEWLADVLQVLCEVAQAGYSFYLSSTDPELEEILSLTAFRDSASLVGISLIPGADSRFSREKIRGELIGFCRKYEPKALYLADLLLHYHQDNWEKNIHLLPDREKTARRQESRKVYLTCSRQIRTLTKEELGVWEALKDCDMNQLCQYSRDTLERFAAMCAYEEGQNQRVEGLLHSGLAQIANYDDVIVSFLGSRRCNLKCKYCFSDHRFQALSTMTDNEMVLITDMLTADRKDLNLHVDNNLGGEPLLDFQAVKDRHNTMVAYHKTRGIKASFGLLTNGTLLGEGHLDWLRTHLPYVGFSVDGDPKTHDKIRRDAGDFATYERVARGIRLLQESKWPVDTGVSAVISKYNMDILGMQKSLRDDLSVSNIVMKPVRAASESDFALNYDCLDSLKEGYRAFFTYLLEEGKKGNLIPLYTMLQPLDYAARFLLRVFFGDRYIVKRCGSGEHIFSVADDGKVYPCDSFNGVEGYEIANMTEGIHNRPGYQVPMVMDENPAFGCKDCFARYLCGGICQYVQYLNHHRHNDVTRMECELARFLAEEAILFWDTARSVWTREQMAQVRERIQTIGFTPAEDGAFFYAPC